MQSLYYGLYYIANTNPLIRAYLQKVVTDSSYIPAMINGNPVYIRNSALSQLL